MKVIWTEEAENGLAEIEEYIAFDNPVADKALTDRLITRAVDLEKFP